MKKIAALIGAGAMLLSVAGPAFAHRSYHQQTGNVAIVTNTTVADAYTGENSVGNSTKVGQLGGGNFAGATQTNNVSINTGAANADATGVVVANTKVGCGCYQPTCGRCGSGDSNTAFVKNNTEAYAGTGGNSVGNSAEVGQVGGGNYAGATQTNNVGIETGAANADATGVVVVNTQLSWMSSH